MSSGKTEKATPKRRRDAAKRGQSWKARDLVVACMILCGVYALVWSGGVSAIGAALPLAIQSGFSLDLHRYVAYVLLQGLKVIGAVLLVVCAAIIVASLLQSRFLLASEALRINFGALNPVNGLKKIFSMRTVKDLAKAILYMLAFGTALWIMWWRHKVLIFSQVHATIGEMIAVWSALLVHLVLTCLGCILFVIVLDALLELFLHLKDLNMDKDEIKREYKELEGDPLIKSKRRQLHFELLSVQEKQDIENSRMVIANPTHVAVAIYFKPEISPIPYVSVKARNQRALAVREYARKMGIPVIADPPLARRLFRTHALYAMVSMDEIHAIVRLLLWLEEVEMAHREPARHDVQDPADGAPPAGADLSGR